MKLHRVLISFFFFVTVAVYGAKAQEDDSIHDKLKRVQAEEAAQQANSQASQTEKQAQFQQFQQQAIDAYNKEEEKDAPIRAKLDQLNNQAYQETMQQYAEMNQEYAQVKVSKGYNDLSEQIKELKEKFSQPGISREQQMEIYKQQIAAMNQEQEYLKTRMMAIKSRIDENVKEIINKYEAMKAQVRKESN